MEKERMKGQKEGSMKMTKRKDEKDERIYTRKHVQEKGCIREMMYKRKDVLEKGCIRERMH